jgi:hypothetical protein
VPDDPDLSRYSYSAEQKSEKARVEKGDPAVFDCGKPFFTPTLDSEGNIRFCCYETANDVFGKVTQEVNAKQVWYSKDSRNLRKFFADNEGNPICKECYFRSTKLNPTVVEMSLLRPLPANVSLIDSYLS